MQAQKDTAVAGLTKGIEGLFKKNKVRTHEYYVPRGVANVLIYVKGTSRGDK